MKKFLILTIALLCATSSLVSAQPKEDLDKMTERRVKMIKLVDKQPKSTGDPLADQFIIEMYRAAALAIATSDQLDGLYYRSIGESADGVTDVTVKKPTAEELLKLADLIAAQAITITNAVNLAATATEAAANAASPALKIKITKAVAITSKLIPLLTTEVVAQGKIIADMVKTATTAKNL